MPSLMKTATQHTNNMSHFSVLVIGDDVEKQLAPYQENNMGDCPKEYLKFNDVTDESRSSYEKKLAGEDAEKFKEEYPTFEDYVTNYEGYELDGKTQLYGYWENPNAKWDWYQEGGRWRRMLQIKPEHRAEYESSHVDSAPIGHVDVAGMRDAAEKEGHALFDRLESVLAGRPIPAWKDTLDKHGKENVDAARKEFNAFPVIVDLRADEVLRDYLFMSDAAEVFCRGDRTAFIARKRAEAFRTFAVVKDGQWFQKGEMGWWGCVSNEKEEWSDEFDKLIDGLAPETRVTVIDCHI